MSLKGTITFSIRPDYDQDVTTSTHVVPSSEYSFEFDQTEGLTLSTVDIQYHFNAWLRSIGYVIDHDDQQGRSVTVAQLIPTQRDRVQFLAPLPCGYSIMAIMSGFHPEDFSSTLNIRSTYKDR